MYKTLLRSGVIIFHFLSHISVLPETTHLLTYINFEHFSGSIRGKYPMVLILPRPKNITESKRNIYSRMQKTTEI